VISRFGDFVIFSTTLTNHQLTQVPNYPNYPIATSPSGQM